MFGCAAKLTLASRKIPQLAEKGSRQERVREMERDRALSVWCHCSPSVSSAAVKERPSTTLNSLELNFNKSQIISGAHGARGKGTKPELTVHIRRFNSHMEVWASQSHHALVFFTERRLLYPVGRGCHRDGSLIVFYACVSVCVRKHIMPTRNWESVIQFSRVLPWPM